MLDDKMAILMTIMASRSSGRRASAAVCLSVVVVLLGGCSGGSSAPQAPALTVTITPTVTVTASRPPPTVTSTAVSQVKSDVVGRRFDLGTIMGVQKEDGVSVIVLDRWTARGVPDSDLAANGISFEVHSDTRFKNLNASVTYRIPVAPGATYAYAHCVDISQPALSESSSLTDFARLRSPERMVLLTLDSQGRAVKARNDPAC